MKKQLYAPPRRKVSEISVLGTTYLHRRNPLVIAFWSVMFPGLGHILLSKYLRGYILFLWEIFVNVMAHVNLSIYYSFTGKFEMAKAVIDIRWVLLYLPTYIFAVWDSYRTTVSLNDVYHLASQENAKVEPFKMNFIEINLLDKSSPAVGCAWSMLMPGLGQLQLHQILEAFFLLIWWIIIVYYSHVLQGIHYSFLGDFETAKSVLNPQWTLNIPSILLFSGYAGYVETLEANKLFNNEQKQFFRDNYQSREFPFPI